MIYALVILGFIIQLIFINYVEKKEYKYSVVFKTIASLSFIIIGFSSTNTFIKFALLFGGLGDLLLELRHLVKSSQLFFIIGSIFFMSEHILLSIMNINSLKDNFILSIVLFVAFTIILRVNLNFCFKRTKKSLYILGSLYVPMLSLMLTASLTNLIYFNSKNSLILFIGSLFFVISDTILMHHMFGNKKPWMHKTSLVFYYFAQVLIALSAIVLL